MKKIIRIWKEDVSGKLLIAMFTTIISGCLIGILYLIVTAYEFPKTQKEVKQLQCDVDTLKEKAINIKSSMNSVYQSIDEFQVEYKEDFQEFKEDIKDIIKLINRRN